MKTKKIQYLKLIELMQKTLACSKINIITKLFPKTINYNQNKFPSNTSEYPLYNSTASFILATK